MNKVSPWISLLPLLLGYAVIVFIFASLNKLTEGRALPYSYAVFYPILMLSGAWSVLGTGSYAVRTICSIAAVMAVGLAGIFGLWLTSTNELSSFDAPLTPAKILIIIGCFSVPLICAAQVPYWLGRLIFGWQLIDESQPPKANKVDLRDMLTITAVLAVCIVAPTQAASMIHRAIVDSVEIGDSEYGPHTDPTTGETTFDEIIVSEENIDHFRQERAVQASGIRNLGLMIAAGYMVFIALSTLVNIPCFYLGMSNTNVSKGFCFAALYWLALAFIPLFAVISFGNPPNGFAFEILNGVILALLFAGATATPMLVFCANGGKLVSRGFFRKLSENPESPMSKEVIDPFGD